MRWSSAARSGELSWVMGEKAVSDGNFPQACWKGKQNGAKPIHNFAGRNVNNLSERNKGGSTFVLHSAGGVLIMLACDGIMHRK